MRERQKHKIFGSCFVFLIFVPPTAGLNFVYATPSTHIWAPSTDIQPYKKVHLTSDFYFPTTKKDSSDNHLYVNQVYGLTFSLLSDKPEDNLLGKFWFRLGKIMSETGFDYKKGYGSVLDTYPWYFHFKLGLPEDAYFKYMPTLAIGAYDMGVRHDKTDYNVWYLKAAKAVSIAKLNLGRFSAGYFSGNGRLLRDKNGLRDNNGPMFAWERTMSEISDKLWLCMDYQGTQSSYGTLNLGFAWRFTNNISAILGYGIYNNRNNTDTITLQIDVDF
ncbi:MAG: hypothetical protein HZA27_02815 [Candidatus Omnitrophica bacterium]|nr:hypothetical protein [Candidatus Omnitrophota bacterium]MBI5145098.1 hypothetical protein [Candidatus Omnitrophota bacterium]